jgi:hypothetical protein
VRFFPTFTWSDESVLKRLRCYAYLNAGLGPMYNGQELIRKFVLFRAKENKDTRSPAVHDHRELNLSIVGIRQLPPPRSTTANSFAAGYDSSA